MITVPVQNKIQFEMSCFVGYNYDFYWYEKKCNVFFWAKICLETCVNVTEVRNVSVVLL